MRVVEITITAAVPDGDTELGHEAVYRTRDPVAGIVAQLEEMGLGDVKQTRRVLMTKGRQRQAREATKPVAVAKLA